MLGTAGVPTLAGELATCHARLTVRALVRHRRLVAGEVAHRYVATASRAGAPAFHLLAPIALSSVPAVIADWTSIALPSTRPL